MVNFGRAADQSDAEVLEALDHWKNRIQYFIENEEPEAVAQARSAYEEFWEEATRRGLR